MAEFTQPTENYNTVLYGQAYAAALSGCTEVSLTPTEDTPENHAVVAEAFGDASAKLDKKVRPSITVEAPTPKNNLRKCVVGAITVGSLVGIGIAIGVPQLKSETHDPNIIHYDNSEEGIRDAEVACQASDSRKKVQYESSTFVGEALIVRSSTDSLVLKGDIASVRIPDEVSIAQLAVCAQNSVTVHVEGKVGEIALGNSTGEVEVDRGTVGTVRMATKKEYNACSIITTPERKITAPYPLGLDYCRTENNHYWSH